MFTMEILDVTALAISVAIGKKNMLFCNPLRVHSVVNYPKESAYYELLVRFF